MIMLSNRPYLVRAFYQWIVDSGFTPILVVDATNPRCKIPQHFAEAGELVLNVAPAAVLDLHISNTEIEFRASFSGVSHYISAPIGSVLAIYAEENGEGLFLDAEEEDQGDARLAALAPIKGKGGERMQLRGIDGSNAEPLDGFSMNAPVHMASKQKPFLKLVE
jgi:stringent starvation protein B